MTCLMIKALIFDVDGTLAETEEGHRAAFNATFAAFGLTWFWDGDLYRVLHKVTGGKERMRHYADSIGVSRAQLPDDQIAEMHRRKNAYYSEHVRAGDCPLRPGVERLIRASRAAGLRLAICTTTSRVNVDELIAATLGANGLDLFEVVVAGEDAPVKKPAPDAYLDVLTALALRPAECLAFEDSRNGLLSAQAAQIATVVTPSRYTAHESFDGALMVLPDLDAFDLRAAGAAVEAAGR